VLRPACSCQLRGVALLCLHAAAGMAPSVLTSLLNSLHNRAHCRHGGCVYGALQSSCQPVCVA
jgi:hypothetical protein